MAIVSRLFKDGAFIALDTETGITSYAYPTSPAATAARKNPKSVGHELIEGEQFPARSRLTDVAEYDRRHLLAINSTAAI